VLLTDLLICRITIHTIPYLAMINPDDALGEESA
jgi:hypothetical protein